MNQNFNQNFRNNLQNRQQQFQTYRQNVQERFEEYTSNRVILAAGACALGGILILTLSLIGGAAGAEYLQRSGYSWFTFVLFLLVTPLGFLIWREIPFVPHAAVGLIGLDFFLDVILSYYRYGMFPEGLIFLKFLVLILILQVVFVYDDDDEDYDEPVYPGSAPPGTFGPGQGGPPGQFRR